MDANYVYESPVVVIGDLRAEAVHLIVAAGNTHEFCPKDLRADNFRLLKISRNENPAFESVARGLRRRGVGKISSRRARDRVESKCACIRQSCGHHTVFETERGRADGVIFDEEVFRTDVAAELRRLDQRREADGQSRFVVLRKRQKRRVAPDVGRTLSNLLAGELSAD